jgi:hypothetical protein
MDWEKRLLFFTVILNFMKLRRRRCLLNAPAGKPKAPRRFWDAPLYKDGY